MGLFNRRTLTPVERLMKAAGLPIAGGELPVSEVAMDVVSRRNGRTAATLAAVEDLLADPGEPRRVALEFLENLQNAASHGTDGLLTTDDVLSLRGPRTVEAWETVERFWSAVASWSDEQGVTLEPAASLRAVEHPALRSTLWPTNRTLPDDRRVGLAEVIRYEQSTGTLMDGATRHTAP